MNKNIETALAELEAEETQQKQTITFEVDDGFVKNLPQILSNISDVKEFIEQQTETDRNLVLQTSEDFERARKRCADLNKIAQQMDEERKRVKREYNRPYELFDKALKETIAVITTAKDNLWGQVTAAENAVRERKEQEYKDYYEEHAGVTGKFRTWEQIFNKSWTNKGYTPEKVKKEIDGIIEGIQSDIDTIGKLKSKHTTELYAYYKSGYSLKDVIDRDRPLDETDETLKGVKALVDEQREQTVTVDFRVTCTKAQMKGLKDYLDDNNIKYGRVPKE